MSFVIVCHRCGTCRGISISVNQLEVLMYLKCPKQFTPYHVRKIVAKALVLCKLNYVNTIMRTLNIMPAYQQTKCREYIMLVLVLFIVNKPKRLILLP